MPDKIRLLHCIETISSGGVDKIRLTLAEGLDKEKYELRIICTQARGALADALIKEGVEIYEVGVFKHPFHWSKYKKVLQIIKKYKPHIIHGAVFEGMSMAAIAGFVGRVPIIVLEETSCPTNRSKKAVWLQRVYSKVADRVIGIAPSVVSFLLENVEISERKVVLINNGVPAPEIVLDERRTELRQKLGMGRNDLIIGSVGRLQNVVKRFTDILQAIRLLNNPSVKFLLVGSGQDKQLIREFSIQAGMNSQFIEVGYQEDTSAYYSLMDVFCIASDNEGFGLVAAEAMFHQLPVVATAVGGLKDIVVVGETGFLVPSHRPDKLAEKLKILIDDPDLRRSMGAKGLARAQAEYSAEAYVGKVHQLYQELLIEKGII